MLGFFAGVVADTVYFQPLGVRAFIYVLAGYFVGMFVARFGTVSPWSVALLAGVTSFLAQFLFGIFQYVMGPRGGFFTMIGDADAPRGRPRRPDSRAHLRAPGSIRLLPAPAPDSVLSGWAKNDPGANREEAVREDDSFVGIRVGVLLMVALALFGVLAFRLGTCRSFRATSMWPWPQNNRTGKSGRGPPRRRPPPSSSRRCP